MIKTDEIRIGNLVLFNNKVVEVFTIPMVQGQFHISYSEHKFSSIMKGPELFSEFNPIPLDSNIMDKVLKHIDGVHWAVEHKNIEFGVMFRLHTIDNEPSYVLCADYGFPVTNRGIKYLHELQNLYLDLTYEQLNVDSLWM